MPRGRTLLITKSVPGLSCQVKGTRLRRMRPNSRARRTALRGWWLSERVKGGAGYWCRTNASHVSAAGRREIVELHHRGSADEVRDLSVHCHGTAPGRPEGATGPRLPRYAARVPRTTGGVNGKGDPATPERIVGAANRRGNNNRRVGASRRSRLRHSNPGRFSFSFFAPSCLLCSQQGAKSHSTRTKGTQA